MNVVLPPAATGSRGYGASARLLDRQSAAQHLVPAEGPAASVLNSQLLDDGDRELPRQRFHDLRHAYATLMIEAGEDLAVVSRSLGHCTISTTADVYAHLTPAIQKRAASRMDAILGHSEAVAKG